MTSRPAVASARFTADELAAVQRDAHAHGRTLAAWLRDCALVAELRGRPGTRTVRAADGAEIQVWTNRPDLLALA